MKHSTIVRVGKLREKDFMKALEEIMQRFPHWRLCVDLEKKNWFTSDWKLTVMHRYNLSTLIHYLDDMF
jgi:hypothetical protein